MFNPANLLTSFNMLSGLFGLLAAISGRMDLVVYCMLSAAVLDFLDGFVARWFGYQSELGKQLDSLADMISFGTLPAVFLMVLIAASDKVVLTTVSPDELSAAFLNELKSLFNGGKINWYFLMPLAIPFFSLFRLAKFNIDKRQLTSFIGLPTPANAFFFLSFAMLVAFPDLTPKALEHTSRIMLSPLPIAFLSVVLSVCLIAPLPLFSLKFTQFKWKGNELRYSLLLISPIIFIVFRTWSFALIVSLYLILSVINNSITKQKST